MSHEWVDNSSHAASTRVRSCLHAPCFHWVTCNVSLFDGHWFLKSSWLLNAFKLLENWLLRFHPLPRSETHIKVNLDLGIPPPTPSDTV